MSIKLLGNQTPPSQQPELPIALPREPSEPPLLEVQPVMEPMEAFEEATWRHLQKIYIDQDLLAALDRIWNALDREGVGVSKVYLGGSLARHLVLLSDEEEPPGGWLPKEGLNDEDFYFVVKNWWVEKIREIFKRFLSWKHLNTEKWSQGETKHFANYLLEHHPAHFELNFKQESAQMDCTSTWDGFQLLLVRDENGNIHLKISKSSFIPYSLRVCISWAKQGMYLVTPELTTLTDNGLLIYCCRQARNIRFAGGDDREVRQVERNYCISFLKLYSKMQDGQGVLLRKFQDYLPKHYKFEKGLKEKKCALLSLDLMIECIQRSNLSPSEKQYLNKPIFQACTFFNYQFCPNLRILVDFCRNFKGVRSAQESLEIAASLTRCLLKHVEEDMAMIYNMPPESRLSIKKLPDIITALVSDLDCIHSIEADISLQNLLCAWVDYLDKKSEANRQTFRQTLKSEILVKERVEYLRTRANSWMQVLEHVKKLKGGRPFIKGELRNLILELKHRNDCETYGRLLQIYIKQMDSFDSPDTDLLYDAFIYLFTNRRWDDARRICRSPENKISLKRVCNALIHPALQPNEAEFLLEWILEDLKNPSFIFFESWFPSTQTCLTKLSKKTHKDFWTTIGKYPLARREVRIFLLKLKRLNKRQDCYQLVQTFLAGGGLLEKEDVHLLFDLTCWFFKEGDLLEARTLYQSIQEAGLFTSLCAQLTETPLNSKQAEFLLQWMLDSIEDPLFPRCLKYAKKCLPLVPKMQEAFICRVFSKIVPHERADFEQMLLDPLLGMGPERIFSHYKKISSSSVRFSSASVIQIFNLICKSSTFYERRLEIAELLIAELERLERLEEDLSPDAIQQLESIVSKMQMQLQQKKSEKATRYNDQLVTAWEALKQDFIIPIKKEEKAKAPQAAPVPAQSRAMELLQLLSQGKRVEFALFADEITELKSHQKVKECSKLAETFFLAKGKQLDQECLDKAIELIAWFFEKGALENAQKIFRSIKKEGFIEMLCQKLSIENLQHHPKELLLKWIIETSEKSSFLPNLTIYAPFGTSSVLKIFCQFSSAQFDKLHQHQSYHAFIDQGLNYLKGKQLEESDYLLLKELYTLFKAKDYDAEKLKQLELLLPKEEVFQESPVEKEEVGKEEKNEKPSPVKEWDIAGSWAKADAFIAKNQVEEALREYNSVEDFLLKLTPKSSKDKSAKNKFVRQLNERKKSLAERFSQLLIEMGVDGENHRSMVSQFETYKKMRGCDLSSQAYGKLSVAYLAVANSPHAFLYFLKRIASTEEKLDNLKLLALKTTFSKRWLACQETINNSNLPAALKKDILALGDSIDLSLPKNQVKELQSQRFSARFNACEKALLEHELVFRSPSPEEAKPLTPPTTSSTSLPKVKKVAKQQHLQKAGSAESYTFYLNPDQGIYSQLQASEAVLFNMEREKSSLEWGMHAEASAAYQDFESWPEAAYHAIKAFEMVLSRNGSSKSEQKEVGLQRIAFTQFMETLAQETRRSLFSQPPLPHCIFRIVKKFSKNEILNYSLRLKPLEVQDLLNELEAEIKQERQLWLQDWDAYSRRFLEEVEIQVGVYKDVTAAFKSLKKWYLLLKRVKSLGFKVESEEKKHLEDSMPTRGEVLEKEFERQWSWVIQKLGLTLAHLAQSEKDPIKKDGYYKNIYYFFDQLQESNKITLYMDLFIKEFQNGPAVINCYYYYQWTSNQIRFSSYEQHSRLGYAYGRLLKEAQRPINRIFAFVHTAIALDMLLKQDNDGEDPQVAEARRIEYANNLLIYYQELSNDSESSVSKWIDLVYIEVKKMSLDKKHNFSKAVQDLENHALFKPQLCNLIK